MVFLDLIFCFTYLAQKACNYIFTSLCYGFSVIEKFNGISVEPCAKQHVFTIFTTQRTQHKTKSIAIYNPRRADKVTIVSHSRICYHRFVTTHHDEDLKENQGAQEEKAVLYSKFC